MSSKFAFLIGSLFGGLAGASITFALVKEKYAQKAESEIESIREFYKSKRNGDETKKQETTGVESPKNEIDYSRYNQILGKYAVSNAETDISEKQQIGEEKPYTISPEEFGELEEYQRVSLTYYADQILADDNDELVDDIDGTVGIDSLTHFGEYEDDSVFVRNDALRCDYEILMDYRKFSDVVAERPPTD